MILYRTTDTVSLFSGRVGLTEDQAKRRSMYLRKVKDGEYEIAGPVQFKAGELIGFTGPTDKGIRSKLVKIKAVKKV